MVKHVILWKPKDEVADKASGSDGEGPQAEVFAIYSLTKRHEK